MPPTPSEPTPTTYRSYAATARSAARFPTRRAFPPDRLTDALNESLDEIVAQRLGPRRQRTCPRVVKRYRAHSHRIKRATDRIQLHPGSPKIHIFAAPCLT